MSVSDLAAPFGGSGTEEAEHQAQQQGAVGEVDRHGRGPFVSRFAKDYLLTTERQLCYRSTDINPAPDAFSALLCATLQYSWPRQFPRQRETRMLALRVNH
jgi:hypothetical protein